ncbi:hypothetical protein GCM10010411_69260 [Actinomadura fulvescens]|uniref:Uncharacterized protein n=1 Tax=Actinomadura fulvescens TaxID=46160 RepID=A0ABN3QD39_9ACTN
MPRRYISAEDDRSGTATGYAIDGALALQEVRRPPELRHTVEATLRLVAEVLAGMRPVRQLTSRALPEVCLAVAAHQVPLAAGVRIVPPRILTSWLQQPVPNAVETGAVVVIDGRVRALALRLEHRRGRWRCVTVETADRGRPQAFP